MPSEACDRIKVERYFLEEDAGAERQAAGRHIETCPACRERLDGLLRERQAYLATHPFPAFAARHLEGTASRPPRQLTRWLPALAGLAACLLVTVIVVRPGRVPEGPQVAEIPEEVRYKGGLVFEFHFRRDGKLQPGGLDLAYRAGDELQFLYSAGAFAYAALASVDDRGHVSLYRAGKGAAAASFPATRGKLDSMPFSVTLDDAPGRELFVLVLGEKPMEPEALEAWLAGAYARSSGDLAAMEKGLQPAGTAAGALKTLLLRKETL